MAKSELRFRKNNWLTGAVAALLLTGTQSTGNGFADFLLGLPDFYSQQSSPPFHESAAEAGLFGEDSWRIKSNFTLNFGQRWDYVTPWAELNHQITALIPGVQSQTFPGAPLGYLVPGDHLPNGQTIPAGIAPTPKDNFSPPFGIAYSPNWSDGWLGKLTGGPGKTSVHLGGGRFFTSPEGLTIAYPTGNPPYGLTYTSTEPPLMSAPFEGALTGTQYIQQFPVDVPPHRVGDQSRYQCELVAVHTDQRRRQRLVPEQDRLHDGIEFHHRSENWIDEPAPAGSGGSESGHSLCVLEPEPAARCCSRFSNLWTVSGKRCIYQS